MKNIINNISSFWKHSSTKVRIASVVVTLASLAFLALVFSDIRGILLLAIFAAIFAVLYFIVVFAIAIVEYVDDRKRGRI